nr:MAG TPA: Transcription factor grauzone, transcription regulation, treble-clef zinc.0A [Caudoviricetes sp.]
MVCQDCLKNFSRFRRFARETRCDLGRRQPTNVV